MKNGDDPPAADERSVVGKAPDFGARHRRAYPVRCGFRGATCTLHNHRCGGKARTAFTKKHAHGTVSLRKRFVGVDLPVGARLTVTVTKPGFVGFAKILTMRAHSGPKVSSRCLRPGSHKLRKHC